MKSTLKNFVKIALATCAFGLAQGAYAGVLPEDLGNQARATLESINKLVDAAVARTEMIYQNLGTNGVIQTSSTAGYAENLLGSTADPYLQHLKIANAGLKIQIQFVGTAMGKNSYGTTGSTVKAPVLPQLLGKKIILVPIYNFTSNSNRDATISSYECLTDADTGLASFMNDVGTREGQQSFISQYSENKYLGKCQYLSTTNLATYWVAS
jgi:hypothetical protein